MKSLIVLGLTVGLAASAVRAGGPVVVVEEPSTVEEKPVSSAGVLPWLAVPLFLCVVLCGPEDDGAKE